MSGMLEKAWIALAILGGLFAIVVSIVADDWDAAWVVFVGGLLILVGVAVRFRFRVTGDVLVVFGSLGLLVPFWLVFPLIVAIVLIVLGIYDATKAARVAEA